MKNLIKKILESSDEFKRSGFDTDGIDMPDDDVQNNRLMNDLVFHPKDKEDLKDWIVKQLKIQGMNANLNAVDVREITDMSYLFSNMKSIDRNVKCSVVPGSRKSMQSNPFIYDPRMDLDIVAKLNPDISEWDVSNVTNMEGMFRNCMSFDRDLTKSNWDVSNVTNMYGMFYQCFKFNHSLSTWKINSSADIRGMFHGDNLYWSNYFQKEFQNMGIGDNACFNNFERFLSSLGISLGPSDDSNYVISFLYNYLFINAAVGGAQML